MPKHKELSSATGCIYGGCSPVEMKKISPAVPDSGTENCESIPVSSNHAGMLMEPSSAPADLIRMSSAAADNISKRLKIHKQMHKIKSFKKPQP